MAQVLIRAHEWSRLPWGPSDQRAHLAVPCSTLGLGLARAGVQLSSLPVMGVCAAGGEGAGREPTLAESSLQ